MMRKILILFTAFVMSFSLISCEKTTPMYEFDVAHAVFNVPESMLAADVAGSNLYGNGYYWLDEATGLGGGIIGDQFYNAGSAITPFPAQDLSKIPSTEWWKYQMAVNFTNENGFPAFGSSRNCLIATGFSYNPTINFTDTPETERIIDHLYVTPTSYTYYQMSTDLGEGVPISAENQGYFLVKFIGLDKNNQKTGEVIFPLAEFRMNAQLPFGYLKEWAYVPLASLGKIHTLKIEFSGSDVGQYGLNTPAYVAISDIVVLLDKGETVTANKDNIYVEELPSLP